MQGWVDPFPIVEFMFAARLLYNAVFITAIRTKLFKL